MFWHHALITCIRWFRTLHIYIHVFFAIICIVFLHHFFWHSTSCSLGARSRHVLQELRLRNARTVSSFGHHFYFGCHVHCSQSSLLYSSLLLGKFLRYWLLVYFYFHCLKCILMNFLKQVRKKRGRGVIPKCRVCHWKWAIPNSSTMQLVPNSW